MRQFIRNESFVMVSAFLNYNILFNDPYDDDISDAIKKELEKELEKELKKKTNNEYCKQQLLKENQRFPINWIGYVNEKNMKTNNEYCKQQLLKGNQRFSESRIDRILKHFKKGNVFENLSNFVSERLIIVNDKIFYDSNKYDIRYLNEFKRNLDSDILKLIFLSSKYDGNDENAVHLMSFSINNYDSDLEIKLRDGYVDQHTHLSASQYFVYLYQNLISHSNILTNKELFNFLRGKHIKGYKQNSFGNILLYLAISRLIMGCQIYTKKLLKAKNFPDEIGLLFTCFMNNMERGIDSYPLDEQSLRELYEGIISLAFGKEGKDSDLFVIHDYYYDQLNYSDPVYQMNIKEMHKYKNTIISERILMYRYYKLFVDSSEINSKEYNLFLKYLIMKNQFYSLLTFDDFEGIGLDLFKRKQNNASKLDPKGCLMQILHNNQGTALKGVEIRVNLPKDSELIERTVKALIGQYLSFYAEVGIRDMSNMSEVNLLTLCLDDKKDFIKFGIDFMIKKDSEKIKTRYHEIKNSVTGLNTVRNSYSFMQKIIVGFDCASHELNEEPRKYSELYKTLRIDGRPKQRSISGFKDIKFTYHVGEEFEDILKGLRAIDEVITHLKYRSGDRISHAICLGIDVKKWCHHYSTYYIKRVELLKNKIWLWQLIADGKITGTDIKLLEEDIYVILEKIVKTHSDIPIRLLAKLYKEHNFEINRDKRCSTCFNCLEANSVNWDEDFLIKTLNCSKVKELLNQIERVEIKVGYEGTSKMIQNYMIKKLVESGIVIELNPSSNMSIGEYSSLNEYHISNLSNPKIERINITINSDDPLTFTTNVSSEYYLVYQMMRESDDYEKLEIANWIHKLCEVSIKTSFLDFEGNREDYFKNMVNLYKNMEV